MTPSNLLKEAEINVGGLAGFANVVAAGEAASTLSQVVGANDFDEA
jgi:hypothetical protein